MRLRLLLFACLLAASTACHFPQQTVTPQRPTVSFDTSTTAKGTFELESGATFDPKDSFDTPNTLKYGGKDDSELFLGWSPWQVTQQPGDDASGSGDVVLGVRNRFIDGDAHTPSFAAVLRGKMPTSSAVEGLSNGEFDFRIGTILNQQFGAINGNAFLQYGLLGDPDGSGTVSEYTGTLTTAWAFDDRFGGFVEVAGIFVPSQDVDSVFTIAGCTFAAAPWLVLDAGCTVGLSRDAPDFQLFCGFTCNFGGPSTSRHTN